MCLFLLLRLCIESIMCVSNRTSIYFYLLVFCCFPTKWCFYSPTLPPNAAVDLSKLHTLTDQHKNYHSFFNIIHTHTHTHAHHVIWKSKAYFLCWAHRGGGKTTVVSREHVTDFKMLWFIGSMHTSPWDTYNTTYK